MNKMKVTKQEAEKLLADCTDDHAFWCSDGRVFRSMRDLADGLASMSDETFAYHANEEKHDFSNWLRDVIEDEKLAKELENSITRQTAVRRVKERISILNTKL